MSISALKIAVFVWKYSSEWFCSCGAGGAGGAAGLDATLGGASLGAALFGATAFAVCFGAGLGVAGLGAGLGAGAAGPSERFPNVDLPYPNRPNRLLTPDGLATFTSD